MVKGTHYTSRKTKPFNFSNYLHYINAIETNSNDFGQINLVINNEINDNYDIIHDYLFRNDNLCHISLYDFISNYEKKQIDRSNNENYKFLINHKQYHSHSMSKIKSPKIPVYLGPSIPRCNDKDNIETYSKIILALFKPWRTVIDLKQNHQTFYSAFQYFIEHQCNNQTKQRINNLELLKKAKLDAESEYKNRKPKNFDNDNQSMISSDSNIDLINDNNPKNKFTLNKLIENIWTQDAIDIIEKNIKNTKSNKRFKFINTLTVKNTQNCVLKNWKKQLKNNVDTVSVSPIAKKTFQLIKTKALKSKHLIIKNYTKALKLTITKFNLYDDQIFCLKAFTIRLIKTSSIPFHSFCTGLPGTGKSIVIKAIQYFFAITNNSHKLMVSATTGNAADNINANTIHSLLNLTMFGNNNYSNPTSYNLNLLQERWKLIQFLILEELSMCGCYLYNAISIQTMKAKNNDLPFGGLNFMGVGDFFQLSPVAQIALYKKSYAEKTAEKQFCNKKVIKNYVNDQTTSLIDDENDIDIECQPIVVSSNLSTSNNKHQNSNLNRYGNNKIFSIV